MTLEKLKALGFTVPSQQLNKRLILGIQARDKRGKTTFGLNQTPRPVAHFDSDIGTEGVIEKFSQNGDVLTWPVDMSERSEGTPAERKAKYEPIWKDLKDKAFAVYDEFQSMGGGTVVFDTATEMDQLCRLAHFGYIGVLSQGDRQNFDVVNADWRSLITKAYKSPTVNTIYICHMREVYNQKGSWERAGVSKLENFVQALVQLDREDLPPPNKPLFSATVLSCRHNVGLIGQRLVDGAPRIAGDLPMGVNFQSLMDTIYS